MSHIRIPHDVPPRPTYGSEGDWYEPRPARASAVTALVCLAALAGVCLGWVARGAEVSAARVHVIEPEPMQWRAR